MSLQANASHGKRREPSDYRRAYAIAVRYSLLSATDSAAAKTLICCTDRWARDLTAKERGKAQDARDAAIKAKKAEGKSKRQIAKETGVAEGTVRNVLESAQKGKRRVSTHPGQAPTPSDPIEADPDDPRQTDLEEFLVEAETAPTGADIAGAKLAEMETPRAQRWHKALAALRRSISRRHGAGQRRDAAAGAGHRRCRPTKKLWLADGYHRLFAHRSVDAVEIDAEVRVDTREDALRLSLAANTTHGKQRTLGDFKRGYDIAVRNGLVEPDDSVGVMDILHCSIRTSDSLTEAAREARERQRGKRRAMPTSSTPWTVRRRCGTRRNG